jgi:hypothetical protein
VKTPAEVDARLMNSLGDRVTDFLIRACWKSGEGRFFHVSCQSPMDWKKVFISIHSQDLPGCDGNGQVVEMGIPYCPKCEKEPAEEGCIHLPGQQV